MTTEVQYTRFAVRGYTAAQWTARNAVPLAREFCYETDTGRAKVGDGVATWSALPYRFESPAGGGVEMRATATHIQYRSGGNPAWINVVALSVLQGEKGDKGDRGEPGAAAVRKSVTVICGGAGLQGVLAVGRTATILRIDSNAQMRVRLYGTVAGRDYDSGRPPSVAPAKGTSLQLEFISWPERLSFGMAPAPIVFNNEESVVAGVPYTLEPRYDAPLSVTFTYLELQP